MDASNVATREEKELSAGTVLEDTDLADAGTEAPAARPYEPPKYRILPLQLYFEEPKRQVYNRHERRRFEELLVDQARQHIKRFINTYYRRKDTD